jgi:hypothetical protein
MLGTLVWALRLKGMAGGIAVLPQYVVASVAQDDAAGETAPDLLRAITVALENDKTAALIDIQPQCPAASPAAFCGALDLARRNGMPPSFQLALVIHSFEHLHAYRFVERIGPKDGACVRLFSSAAEAKAWLAGGDACG